MNSTDLLAILPVILLAATAVAVLMTCAFYRRHQAAALVCQSGLLLSLAALVPAADRVPRIVTPLIVMDSYALYFTGLILITTFAVAALAYDYLERRCRRPEEFYVLLLTASLGAVVLAASRHFASFFLGVELLSVPLFGMIAYHKGQWRPLEAGTKYLILSGTASAFLLFGMAAVYFGLGTMTFTGVTASITAGSSAAPYVLAGIALILVGLGFKLSLVPFHMWVADVYQGAPAPVSAYIATVSKGSVFALLLRYVAQTGVYRDHTVAVMVTALAVASMLIGNLLALRQESVKRVLAYSSVAHMGYLLVAVMAGGAVAVEAVGYYMAAYFVTIIGAFGVVTLISAEPGGNDTDAVDDYQGLFWRRPWLAGVLTAMLLSLAGIPVTMGFVAKFYVLAAGVSGALWALVYVLIVASAVGLYYYLRIVIALYRPVSERLQRAPRFPSPFGGAVVVMAAAVLLLWLGVYPEPLIDLLHATAGAMK